MAEQFGWDSVDKQERLEGFKDPWEFAVCKGRALKLDASLQDNNIVTDAVITAVRRVLVPEAWKVGMHQHNLQPRAALLSSTHADLVLTISAATISLLGEQDKLAWSMQ